jgi:hypothetical protein
MRHIKVRRKFEVSNTKVKVKVEVKVKVKEIH